MLGVAVRPLELPGAAPVGVLAPTPVYCTRSPGYTTPCGVVAPPPRLDLVLTSGAAADVGEDTLGTERPCNIAVLDPDGL